MKYQLASIAGILLLKLTITTTTVYSQDEDTNNSNNNQSTSNSFIPNVVKELFLVFEEGSGNETTISNDGEFDSYD